MDIETAKSLRAGDEIYHKELLNADGNTAQRFRVTSVRTWKRTPDRIEVRVKRGLYEFGTIDTYNLHAFTTKEPDYEKR